MKRTRIEVPVLVFTLALAAASIACQRSPTPTAELAPASAAPPNSALASAGGVAAPSPSASATPRAVPVETAPTALFLYVDVRADLDFVAGPRGGILVSREGGDVVRIDGDTVTRAYGFLRPLVKYIEPPPGPSPGHLESFGGTYPDHVYAIVGEYGTRGTLTHVVHQWLGMDRWRELMGASEGVPAHISAVAPRGRGFAAAIVSSRGYEIGVDTSPSFTPQPRKGNAEASRLAEVKDLEAQPGGGLVAVGLDQDERGAEAIEVFSATGKSTGVHHLPDLEQSSIVVPSEGEVVVWGSKTVAPAPAAAPAPAPAAKGDRPVIPPSSYIAVLHGEAWSELPLPGDRPFRHLAASPDGSLWAAAEHAVWHRPRSGAWSKVTLPDGADPTSVVPVSASEVWAIEQGTGTMKVYRSRAPKWPIMAGPPREKVPPLAAARPDCATPFVVLGGLTSHAAPDYDFPLTRAAMKGHAELAGVTLAVTEDWLLGAFVPSADVAEKLAAVIRAGVKGQKPQITCGEPRIRYTVPINLETGEAVK